MSLITWNDYFVTGIDEIDSQHRRLIDLISRSARVLVLPYEAAHTTADKLLDTLTDYVIYHFDTEARLMSEHGIDPRHSEHHLREHADFVARVGEMRRRYEQEGNISGGELLTFLANWLVFHILADDQVLGRQLRAIRAGHGPDEAFESAEGSEADPAQRAQTRALIDLYQLINVQYAHLQAANQELEMHRGRLEELVARRTTQLAEARDLAEAASRAKSAFLANISHEFRTPLNAIVGMNWVLLQQIADSGQRDKLQLIARASERLLGMLDEVLDMVKLEAEQLTLEPVDFDPRTLIERQAAHLAAKAEARGIETALEISGALPGRVRADAARIEQIVDHVLDNAVKFTARGRIALRAEMRPPAAGGDAGAAPLLCIDVEDSGCGIAADQLPKLFRPFAQANGGTARTHGGTGLSLALCKRLALLQGGDIEVDSTPGRGSRFRIELPVRVVVGDALDAPSPSDASATPATTSPATAAIGEPDGGAPPDAAAQLVAGDLLARLRALVAEDDSRALTLWHESRPLLQACLGAHAAQLERALAGYDFQAALVVIDAVPAAGPRRRSTATQ
ncbi:MAG TPA: bacteriohemerythrin [Azospira sp.]|nr:bacteriohemerythrin [Azospira sp.]